jgi:hypothetical protein
VAITELRILMERMVRVYLERPRSLRTRSKVAVAVMASSKGKRRVLFLSLLQERSLRRMLQLGTR